MGRRFRCGLTLVTALTLGSGAWTAVAPAAGAQSTGLDCGSKAYRITFWPKGHKAIRSVGFPAFATPHLELWTGTGLKFPNAKQVGYADPTGVQVAPTCRQVNGPQVQAIQRKKVVNKAVVLTCKYGRDPLINTGQASDGARALNLVVNGRATAFAFIRTAGSTLTYNPKFCKATKPPH